MSLRHAVLGLLTEGPASGYDLLKLFDASLSNVWPATQSQLYGELSKLADAGLISVSAEGPRGRKEYALNDEGLAELRRWMLEVEPTRPLRNDMLLRVFFLAQVDPEQARSYIRDQAAIGRKYQEHLEGIRERIGSGTDNLSTYGRLALEWGLRFSRTQQEWAEWAEEQIR
ncbi:PadR family transcriptional regulator [Nonomuraea typhae]|uniref:PadR family transcriptional regulator n=1 Tax=Nonomuraea typhae TaxID=2603600 RepID=UPI0012FA6A84|nr:PadR family transcriptional regulator [Nonomuraea typhae]